MHLEGGVELEKSLEWFINRREQEIDRLINKIRLNYRADRAQECFDNLMRINKQIKTVEDLINSKNKE